MEELGKPLIKSIVDKIYAYEMKIGCSCIEIVGFLKVLFLENQSCGDGSYQLLQRLTESHKGEIK